MTWDWDRSNKRKMGNDLATCPVNHSHRSKLEASVCATLYLRKRAGEFKEILIEQTVYLTEARIPYVVDFCCETPGGQLVYVEAKGFETASWRTKLKLWASYGPAPLEIWKGNAYRPMLHKIVKPKGFE